MHLFVYLSPFRDDDAFIYREGSRSYLNQAAVDRLETLHADKVPDAPNGPVKYRVKYVEREPLSAVADNWNWGRSQHVPRKDFCKEGRRTLQYCNGSYECQNDSCPYKKIQCESNKVDFRKGNKCTHCNVVAKHIECLARKYVENDRCHKIMTVIYIGTHDCNPRATENKPSKESIEEYLKTRPTSTTRQLQVDKVREALLSGKAADEVADIASQFCNQRHIQYLKAAVDKTNRPGGSDIEAIRKLKEDFQKRNLDENLILEMGDDYVILSSSEKIRIGVLITLGLVSEPVSLDGCESLAKDYTEVELTTYFPLLRRNVKLVSMFCPKPGENSENVAKMVKAFDAAIEKMLPTVAKQYDIDPREYTGKGLDAGSYVGDEGGALWKGLCQAKGREIKNRTVSDLYHFKQDVRRHNKHFTSKSDQIKFKKIMNWAYDAVTSIEAKKAEEELEKLIKTRCSDPTTMLNFKKWWWRRRARWQKWCRTSSTSNASSAEVANAKSVASGGYRKRLLDVITTECSSAVLEGAEVKRQDSGQKTVGRGPSSADRVARQAVDLDADIERSAAAIQNLSQSSDITQSLSNIEMAQDDYNINVKDTHRADKKRKSQKKKSKEKGAAKKKLKFFEKNVQDVNIDVVKCDVSMSKFCFTLLDTMGYIQEVTITKDAVSCMGPSCSGFCSHSTWCLHKIFHFSKEEDFIFKKNFNNSEWGQIIKAFPERVPLVRLPKYKEGFFVNVRQSQKDANCATCKHLLQSGDVQVSTEGPYRTIMRHWISRTFYFCPKLGCISKQPRNSFIQTYCPGATKLEFDKHLSPAQQVLH